MFKEYEKEVTLVIRTDEEFCDDTCAGLFNGENRCIVYGDDLVEEECLVYRCAKCLKEFPDM